MYVCVYVCVCVFVFGGGVYSVLCMCVHAQERLHRVSQ